MPLAARGAGMQARASRARSAGEAHAGGAAVWKLSEHVAHMRVPAAGGGVLMSACHVVHARACPRPRCGRAAPHMHRPCVHGSSRC